MGPLGGVAPRYAAKYLAYAAYIHYCSWISCKHFPPPSSFDLRTLSLSPSLPRFFKPRDERVQSTRCTIYPHGSRDQCPYSIDQLNNFATYEYVKGTIIIEGWFRKDGETVIMPSLGKKKIAWKLSMNYPSGRNERRLPSFVPRTSRGFVYANARKGGRGRKGETCRRKGGAHGSRQLVCIRPASLRILRAKSEKWRAKWTARGRDKGVAFHLELLEGFVRPCN